MAGVGGRCSRSREQASTAEAQGRRRVVTDEVRVWKESEHLGVAPSLSPPGFQSGFDALDHQIPAPPAFAGDLLFPLRKQLFMLQDRAQGTL